MIIMYINTLAYRKSKMVIIFQDGQENVLKMLLNSAWNVSGHPCVVIMHVI